MASIPFEKVAHVFLPSTEFWPSRLCSLAEGDPVGSVETTSPWKESLGHTTTNNNNREIHSILSFSKSRGEASSRIGNLSNHAPQQYFTASAVSPACKRRHSKEDALRKHKVFDGEKGFRFDGEKGFREG